MKKNILSLTIRLGLSCAIIIPVVLVAGCGGSVGSSTTPPPRQGVPSRIVVSSGDQQNGVPGETLPFPLDVVLMDGQGAPVPNQAVTFSLTGGQVFPSSVMTTDTGHARALVGLPNITFTTVTITASASGLKASLVATTGPRLQGTFGDVSAAHGTARSDGSYVGVSQSNDYLPSLGYDLFAPDGTLTSRLGVPQGKMGVPGLYDNLWSVAATPNENLYFRSVLSSVNNGSVYVVGIDSSLNLVQFSDLARTRTVDDATLTGPMVVDLGGNIYIAQGNLSSYNVFVFDASGKKTNQIVVGNPISGLALSNPGNLVALVSNPVTGFSSFKEYSMAGNLVNSPSTLPFSALATMTQDSVGNYLVLENTGPLYKFDQNYNLLSTSVLNPPVFGSGQAVTAGTDGSGNFYVSSNFGSGLLKYDASGNLLAVTAWPIQSSCSGCPTPSYINQLANPTGMAVDPVTSDLYVADDFSSTFMGPAVLRYTNQQFTTRLTLPVGEFADDVAIGTARELYVADVHYNKIHVLDLSGNELRALQGPQIGTPASIAIDANDNKYVLDSATNTIHVLDSSDQLIRNIPVNASGNIRVAPDGTLMLTEWMNGQRTVKRLATDGTQLFSATYSTASFVPYASIGDANGNMFLAGNDHLKVLDPSGTELGQFDLNVYSAPPCGLTVDGNTVYVCYLNRISAFSAK